MNEFDDNTNELLCFVITVKAEKNMVRFLTKQCENILQFPTLIDLIKIKKTNIGKTCVYMNVYIINTRKVSHAISFFFYNF